MTIASADDRSGHAGRTVHARGLPSAVLAAAFAAALALAALPAALTAWPPLVDYPNHVSRAHVMATGVDHPDFRAWFEPAGLLIPNVLSDLVMAVAAPAVGAEAAGRALIVLIHAAALAGVWLLGVAARRRPDPWPLLAGALVHHEMLGWGFLNYCLGMGVALLGLAGWIASEGRRPAVRIAVGTAAAGAAFAAHLVALGALAVMVGAVEAERAWRTRREGLRALSGLALAGAAFAPLPALLLAASPAGDLPAAPLFAFEAYHKLSPYTRLLATGSPVADGAMLAVLVATLAAAALRGWVAVDRRLGLAALALVGAQLVLPHSAMQSYYLDQRLPVLAMMVAAAGLHLPRRRAGSTRAAAAVLSLCLALTAARAASVAVTWAEADARYAPFVAALDRVPRGSVLVGADGSGLRAGWVAPQWAHPPLGHLASAATVRRDAIVPSIFAKAGQNPIAFRPVAPSVGAIPAGAVPPPEDRLALMDALAGWGTRLGAELAAAGEGRRRVYAAIFGAGCGDLPPDPRFEVVGCDGGHVLLAVPTTSPGG